MPYPITMDNISAVINKSAGTLSPEQSAEQVEKIKADLEKWVPAEKLTVTSGEEVRESILQLIQQKPDLLIVGGGDGTVSTAAELLGETDIVLGVIALGTRNHFARDMGIPLNYTEAIALLDLMHIRYIDMGEVNGKLFINNATLGIYPRLVEEREAEMERRGWKKWWAQIVAALKVLHQFPQMRMTVSVKEKEYIFNRYTPFIFVGNNEYRESVDTGFMRSSLKGGKLWFCMSRSAGVYSLLRMAWQVKLKGVQHADDLDCCLVSSLNVNPHRSRVRIAIDGETYTMRTPLKFRIRKEILQVLVP